MLPGPKLGQSALRQTGLLDVKQVLARFPSNALFFPNIAPIYKMMMEYPRCEAVFPAFSRLIPRFHADFPGFTQKVSNIHIIY
jgi:hypothetical protein